MSAETRTMQDLAEQVARLTDAVHFLLFAFQQLPVTLHPYEAHGIAQLLETFDDVEMSKAVTR